MKNLALKTMLVCAATLLTLASQAQAQSRFDDMRFIDIRDLVTYPGSPDRTLGGTAKKLMEAMEAAPGRFVGPIVNNTQIQEDANTLIRFYREGAKGPSGTIIEQNGKNIFSPTTLNEETRQDSILSVELEQIIEEQHEKTFSLQILMFVHDSQDPEVASSNGYYFRRLWIRVDWNAPNTLRDRVQVWDHIQDIPLNQTQFSLKGDLLERKIILEEPTYRIYKVFPIAVGAFDIRTAPGMDNSVKSMTPEFPNAVLKNVKFADTGSQGYNTRSRVYPNYYKGRPFLGLFADGTTYRSIGFHYQITDYLIRGFASHGCIRVRDKDLYQLDAILNEGALKQMSAEVVYNLKGYEDLNHPMPQVNNEYKVTLYSTDETAKVIKCKNSSYAIRFYGEGEYKNAYHTVADDECLTMVVDRKASALDVINYMKGIGSAPTSLVDGDNIVVVREDGTKTGWNGYSDPSRPKMGNHEKNLRKKLREVKRSITAAETARKFACIFPRSRNCERASGKLHKLIKERNNIIAELNKF